MRGCHYQSRTERENDMSRLIDVEKVVRELRDLKMRYYLTIANTGDADKDWSDKQ